MIYFIYFFTSAIKIFVDLITVILFYKTCKINITNGDYLFGLLMKCLKLLCSFSLNWFFYAKIPFQNGVWIMRQN